MSRTAVRPLNPAAVQAADDEFYANHPEYVREDGTRIPLDPSDPSQADLRREWMDSYIDNGGEVEESPPVDHDEGEAVQECPLEEEEPGPTIEARWSKPEVTPNHNSVTAPTPPSDPPRDTVPEEAKVQMLVTTTLVPDNTTARIEIRHCETGALVPGAMLNDLVVQGNRVIDPETGDAPLWVFEARHRPWDPWDKPYFFFEVWVNYEGLHDETPRDYETQEPECLRVKYWHVCLSESGDLGQPTRDECSNVKGLLEGVEHSQGDNPDYTTEETALNIYGSHIRNTYVFHQCSHGNLRNRATNAGVNLRDFGDPEPNYDDPPDDLPDPGNWRGTVEFTPMPRFGDTQIGQEADIPSVPRYLWYASTCLTGWESSFADAMIRRGCRNVIAFRRTIPNNEAPQLARDFYTKWANDYNIDPEKIPDAFFQYAGDHYDGMRPVLFGPGGGRAGEGGLSGGEIAAIVIAAVVGGALLGLAVWALLK